MELGSLSQELIDRLLGLETQAQHLTALAAVADAYAHVARGKADAAQRSLSEIKIFVALLDDGATFRLLAPLPDAEDPAQRLGIRPHLPAPSAPPRIRPGAPERPRETGVAFVFRAGGSPP
jgi:hypothetical protein